MSGYIGNIPVPQATQTRDVFTATSGQTTFATSGYTPGFLDVWLNGVKLVNGTDFTATNGSDVVLTSGAAASDIVEVLSYSTFEVNSQTFTGTTTLSGDLQATTATFSGAVTGTDLTLSGGVYLGGTGAANYLTDYEEGTFTLTIGASVSDPSGLSYSTQSGTYTKVGNVVYVSGRITFSFTSATGSGALRIGGLPFTVGSGFQAKGAVQHDNISFTGYEYIEVGLVSSTNQMSIGKNRSGSTAAGVGISDANAGGTDISFGVFYFV